MQELKVITGEKIVVSVEDLHEFQGDLKDLSVENYERAKRIFLKRGFAFCPHVWTVKGKHYLLDGHQRKRVLQKMKEEGYKIPKIHAVVVKAGGMKEAKELVLAAASQFGEVTQEGLYQFVTEAEIPPQSLQEHFNFPEVKLPQFMEAYFTEPREVSFQAKGSGQELGEGSFDKFEHKCPKCKFEFND